MLTAQSPYYEYQVGGSLPRDALSYVRRQADEELFQALLRSEFCYVLNSRQMGKSSLWVQTMHRLQAEGICCGVIDLTAIGTQEVTPEQWYASVVASLSSSFQLSFNLRAWWRDRTHLSLVSRLSEFIETILLVEIQQNVVIFIDEIDSLLSLDFPTDDFFALIRECYNKRAQKSSYKRLTFALLGVATPPDLIADKNRTPFNIGRAIELRGFDLHEAIPLIPGLQKIASQPEVLLAEILYWTSGQPFLTQKLCQLALMATNRVGAIPAGEEARWVEQLVQERIIDNWEASDEPEHLRTIRDRLLRNEQRAGRLLGIYQQILYPPQPPLNKGGEQEQNFTPLFKGGQGGIFADDSPEQMQQNLPPLNKGGQGGVAADDSPEQMELLLSGLVVKRDGKLTIRNPIYAAVFNQDWVNEQLENLRPYAKMLTAWLDSNCTDSSRLLRGQALREALDWAASRSLSNQDYQFLAASQELDKREVQLALEAQRLKEVEARLVQQKKSARRQKLFIAALSLALAIAIGLGITAFREYNKAVISERNEKIGKIQGIARYSEALFALDKRLDALIEALRAKQQLQQLGTTDPQTAEMVELALRRAIYGAVEYNHFSGLSGWMNALAISPDGETIAVATSAGSVQLWQHDGTLLGTLKGHIAPVLGVAIGSASAQGAIAPDTPLIASGSGDTTVKLWQHDGTLLKTLIGHKAPIYSVKFSPDGQLIVSASMDSTVKLWRRDGTLLKTLTGHSAVVRKAVFSPEGELVASASEDSTVKLWRVDGTLLKTLTGHQSPVLSVAFSSDGNTIAAGTGDGTVKLWKSDGTLLRTIAAHEAGVQAVAFSPDGQTIASGSDNQMLKLWKSDGTLLFTIKAHGGAISDVSFSPNGDYLASTSFDGTVKLWKLRSPLLTILRGHTAGVWGAVFSPNGEIIASLSGNEVLLWRKDGKLLRRFEGRNAAFGSVAISPDGRIIAAVSADKSVKLWSPDGRLLKTLRGHGADIRRVAFSPDGKIVATSSGDTTVKLWRLDGTELATLKGHKAGVWGVAFSPDAEIIVSSSGDKTLKLWRRDGRLLKTLQGHSGPVSGVAFSPDGEVIASASDDKTAKLWSRDGRLLHTLEGHISGVWSVAFSPDSKTIATGSSDGMVKLWKRDGTEITTLIGHSARIGAVAFSLDGKTLASASEDKTVILWDLERSVDLDKVLAFGCDWVRDYLRTNAEVKQEDRYLCEGVKTQNAAQ